MNTYTIEDIRTAQEILTDILVHEFVDTENLSGVSVDSVIADLIRVMTAKLSISDGKVVFA